MAKQRAVIRLAMESASKKQVDDVCKERGMTQIAVLSRLVKWFASQDEMVQASILGLLSEQMVGDVSKRLLDRLQEAAGKSPKRPSSARM
jgi:hypothetical protein